MKNVKEHLNNKMKDVRFKEHYELDLVKLEFVKPIIEYRIKHKLTQAGLAKKTGISQQQISKIENGDFSNFDTVIKVLFAIGVRITKVETHKGKPFGQQKAAENKSYSHK